MLLPASVCLARPMSLDGMWRFMIDPTDSGEKNQWFKPELPVYIKLPGIMQSQFGMDISTSTPWVLSLYDRFWYLRDDYKAYLEPGKVKVPFLSQPPRHYLGVAWYQRDIQIVQYQQAPALRAESRASSLGNDCLARWGEDRIQPQSGCTTRLRPRYDFVRSSPAHDSSRQSHGHAVSTRCPQRFRFTRRKLERHHRQDRTCGHRQSLD